MEANELCREWFSRIQAWVDRLRAWIQKLLAAAGDYIASHPSVVYIAAAVVAVPSFLLGLLYPEVVFWIAIVAAVVMIVVQLTSASSPEPVE